MTDSPHTMHEGFLIVQHNPFSPLRLNTIRLTQGVGAIKLGGSYVLLQLLSIILE